jgi:hypothetical protein
MTLGKFRSQSRLPEPRAPFDNSTGQAGLPEQSRRCRTATREPSRIGWVSGGGSAKRPRPRMGRNSVRAPPPAGAMGKTGRAVPAAAARSGRARGRRVKQGKPLEHGAQVNPAKGEGQGLAELLVHWPYEGTGAPNESEKEVPDRLCSSREQRPAHIAFTGGPSPERGNTEGVSLARAPRRPIGAGWPVPVALCGPALRSCTQCPVVACGAATGFDSGDPRSRR